MFLQKVIESRYDVTVNLQDRLAKSSRINSALALHDLSKDENELVPWDHLVVIVARSGRDLQAVKY